MSAFINLVNPSTGFYKTLLIVCMALCGTAQANSNISLTVEETALQTQHTNTVNNCAAKLAAAQCRRQAGLDFNQAKHSLKLKHNARAAQFKRDKQAQQTAEKANHATINQAGEDGATKTLAREPLVKKNTQNSATLKSLSHQSMPKSVLSKKPPLAKQSRPAKGAHRDGHLTAQPTPHARRNNQTAFASNAQAITSRQQHTENKKTKRLTKDEARRAAGYSVDKP
jgi:hypothetical protein